MQQNSKYKPFYKQFLRLRKNIQNRPKLFKFKRQKWKKFQQYSKTQLAPFKRFKIKDQFQFSVSKFASKGNSFQKKFRDNLHELKGFGLFYGKLKKKYLKKHMLTSLKAKTLFDYRHRILKFFESRLDIILYRAHFSLTVESARQYILHGHILVNGVPVTIKSYILQENDLIEVHCDPKGRKQIKESLDRSNFWPIPPKHLIINYKTLQIIFSYTNSSNSIPIFNHYLNINALTINMRNL